MSRLLIILYLLFSFGCSSKAELNKDLENRLKKKAVLAKSFCEKNDFNTKFCMLVDMKIHSGKKRFFLWDFKSDSVLNSGMCSHGTCGNLAEYDSDLSPQFSNVPESHCSSLGKYRIGKRGYSTFGININYKLHGLEKTNNNAFKRYIVFHSWEIPEDEVYLSRDSRKLGLPSSTK